MGWRSGLQTKLFAAFFALLALTVAVVWSGVAGMRHNQQALDAFDASVMPEIARVLQLAEKVAQLAAVAPGVADAGVQLQFPDDSKVMPGLMDEIRRLSKSLEQQGNRLGATGLLDGIDKDLSRLLATTMARRDLQTALRAQQDELDAVGKALFLQRDRLQKSAPTLPVIWAGLVGAGLAADAPTLGRVETEIEALWLLATAQAEDRRWPELARALRALTDGDLSVPTLRRQLLKSERELTTLVQITRGHADSLGTRASAYVEDLRQVAAQRREAVRQTVLSNESRLMLLGALAIAVALAGALYGDRLLRQLRVMTGVMTRLAAGESMPAMPATERADEIGALARAFQIFRRNLLDKQRLAGDMAAQARLLEAVFNSVNDGIAVYAADGRLATSNPHFKTLIPLPTGLLDDRPHVAALNAALPPGSRWQAATPASVAHPPGTVRRIAASVELHPGGGRVIELRSHAMPDGGWVSVCRDLSASRAVEAQLRQAQRMEVLGQLTGGVAHDFNNFLSAILGNLESLRDKLRDDPPLQACALRAHRAAESAAGLTRRLLAFTRRQPAELETVPVGEMLEEMLDLVAYSVGTAVEVRIGDVAPYLAVRVDRGQLENAILNMALNSAAAMPEGGLLSLAAEEVACSDQLQPPGRAVVLSVRDTGHGIPADLQARVLEPFFSTRPAGEGTGLGLSIVDAFVRQHGGSLQISSAPGAGTAILISLPAVAPEAAPPVEPTPVPSAPTGARVLVVEDNAAVRDTAVALFAGLGAQVVAVDSEAAALARVEADGRFDLVFTDVMLGRGGDGVSLARELSRRWPGQRVVLTSGLPLEVHAQRAAWPAAASFVPKPYTRQTLAGLLTEVDS